MSPAVGVLALVEVWGLGILLSCAFVRYHYLARGLAVWFRDTSFGSENLCDLYCPVQQKSRRIIQQQLTCIKETDENKTHSHSLKCWKWVTLSVYYRWPCITGVDIIFMILKLWTHHFWNTIWILYMWNYSSKKQFSNMSLSLQDAPLSFCWSSNTFQFITHKHCCVCMVSAIRVFSFLKFSPSTYFQIVHKKHSRNVRNLKKLNVTKSLVESKTFVY